MFRAADVRLLASIIKALVQNWYLKRGKYRDRDMSVTTYAQTVRDGLAGYLLYVRRLAKDEGRDTRLRPKLSA